MTTPLSLDLDSESTAPLLADVLAQCAIDPDLGALLRTIAHAAIPLGLRLAQGHVPGDPTAIVGTNESGDRVKALDLAAHLHYLDALAGASVSQVLSEEAEGVIRLNPQGKYDVAMDPIDGSGSIGIGAPLGALFSIFPAGHDFLREGREMIAAAYVSFGHSVDFGYSTGEGVAIATLDPISRQWHVDAPSVSIQPESSTVAFNASNLRRWEPGLRAYVDGLLQGADGPRRRDFNMRWIAAAVGDLHRILRQGGTFLLPADPRPAYRDGYLRLVYEAFPIAFLIEAAGGSATDGRVDILDKTPASHHAKTPLVFGSRNEVAVIGDHLTA
ncbi:class 1 fructose-bisphosphatase [Sagittula salina]|uniref:Fructose-1,6-bisphosphatase class 1 n=1 Tax=Sagittula salina TaxID=2820268 RepID=A0A940MMI8_9RHOB|nr:class 1 fructose-bisphosphatase [Sagittula salina]MBP0481426.1 fructose-1,6-bisphosphatase [Sagittula salina]